MGILTVAGNQIERVGGGQPEDDLFSVVSRLGMRAWRKASSASSGSSSTASSTSGPSVQPLEELLLLMGWYKRQGCGLLAAQRTSRTMTDVEFSTIHFPILWNFRLFFFFLRAIAWPDPKLPAPIATSGDDRPLFLLPLNCHPTRQIQIEIYKKNYHKKRE